MLNMKGIMVLWLWCVLFFLCCATVAGAPKDTVTLENISKRMKQRFEELNSYFSEILVENLAELHRMIEALNKSQEDMHQRLYGIDDLKVDVSQIKESIANIQSDLHPELESLNNTHVDEITDNGCVVGNKTLQKDEKAVVRFRCLVCDGKEMVPVSGGFSKPCPPDFSWQEGIGCLHVMKEMKTFDEANDACCSKGCNLVVPENFERLQEFEKKIGGQGWGFWIGMRARSWLDGRDVAPEEWSGGRPSGALSKCGVIRRDTSLVGHSSCTATRFSICQLG